MIGARDPMPGPPAPAQLSASDEWSVAVKKHSDPNPIF
jgi:hypothetical protein